MKDYKKLAQDFNTARMNMPNEVLTGSEMYNLLTKVIGFGKDANLLSLLNKKKIIVHVGHNMYTFPKTPVYYGKLQIVLQMHHKNKYNRSKQLELQRAIKICQKNGYTVVNYTC